MALGIAKISKDEEGVECKENDEFRSNIDPDAVLLNPALVSPQLKFRLLAPTHCTISEKLWMIRQNFLPWKRYWKI